jgi:hypothetical protein
MQEEEEKTIMSSTILQQVMHALEKPGGRVGLRRG